MFSGTCGLVIPASDSFVQLVELVQHEQNSPWAGCLDRYRNVELEHLEAVLIGKGSIQRDAEGSLEGPAGITRGLTGNPGLDPGVMEGSTDFPCEQSEDFARSDADL